ncbi:unnamed protein product [Brassica oleracea var. botrytis]|uniref:Uncharacterized protein n=1 Tax=Brassica oleracea TaxID=3712 RepID=A0A3P6FS26_BRAOL|nr:uncharacterized protein LOC106412004 isoform X1 [Brassica napus]VDD55150.1 unnamed protein product [Brassica oleracea]
MWSNDCYLPRLMIITPSIPQSQAYHDFADQRSFFGLMNTREITESYDGFFTTVESLIDGTGDFSVEKEFMSHVSTLCKYGLDSLVHDHFLISLLDYEEEIHQVLCKALEEISIEKQYHDKCMSMETLAFTLVACHLELVPETLSVFSADTEGKFIKFFCLGDVFDFFFGMNRDGQMCTQF